MNVVGIFTSSLKPRQVVRQAEKICRIVTSEFPMVSSSKARHFNSFKSDSKFGVFVENLNNRINNLFRRGKIVKTLHCKGAENYYLDYIKTMKEKRVGNCGEGCKLAGLIGELNGIKTYPASLVSSPEDAHAVQILFLNDRYLTANGKFKFNGRLSNLKDAIIVDPWLGFADTVSNALKKYKLDFPKQIGIKSSGDIFISTGCSYQPLVSENLIKILKEKHPQFFIEKGKPLIRKK